MNVPPSKMSRSKSSSLFIDMFWQVLGVYLYLSLKPYSLCSRHDLSKNTPTHGAHFKDVTIRGPDVTPTRISWHYPLEVSSPEYLPHSNASVKALPFRRDH